MQKNPSKQSFNFSELRKTINNAKAHEEKKEIPGFDFKIEEQNFITFSIQQNENQIKLQTYRKKAKDQSQMQGIVILIHGLNSYTESYKYLFEQFSNNNYECLGFDFPGFAKSEGIKGYVPDMNWLPNVTEKFIEEIDKLYDKALPKFILGQSMGGLSTILFSLKHEFIKNQNFKGMILLAPAIKTFNKFANTFIAKKLAGMLNYVMPLYYGREHHQNNWINNKNPAVVEFDDNNPIKFSGGRIGTLNSITKGMSHIQNNIQNITLPFLLFHGGKDKVCDVEGSIDFFERTTQNKNKTFYFLPNCWHNIAMEEEIFEIAPIMIEWLNSFKN